MEIVGKDINIDWLVKVRGHHDKVEKEQQKIEPKKMSALSGYTKFKADFLLYCDSQYPEFKNIHTFATLNKTSKNHKEPNNASKIYQDDSCHFQISTVEEEKKCTQ